MRHRVCGLVLLLGSIVSATPQPPPSVLNEEPASFHFPMPDWSQKRTWVKAALLAGAAVLVKMSFRKMREEDRVEDE